MIRLKLRTKPVCPYCNFELSKIPETKKKCPNCENFIYVRIHPHTKSKILITEEEETAKKRKVK